MRVGRGTLHNGWIGSRRRQQCPDRRSCTAARLLSCLKQPVTFVTGATISSCKVNWSDVVLVDVVVTVLAARQTTELSYYPDPDFETVAGGA
jgi:hypothetical protein